MVMVGMLVVCTSEEVVRSPRTRKELVAVVRAGILVVRRGLDVVREGAEVVKKDAVVVIRGITVVVRHSG